MKSGRSCVRIGLVVVSTVLTGCNLVYLSSPVNLPGVEAVDNGGFEGEWVFVKSESDIKWWNHRWRVRAREKTGFELTEIVNGSEVPYTSRGRLLKVDGRILFQVQARSWPPGTVPVYALYEVKSQTEDRIVLASPEQSKMVEFLKAERFESLNVLRKEDYPILVSSSGKLAAKFLRQLLDRGVFTQRLVYERVGS